MGRASNRKKARRRGDQGGGRASRDTGSQAPAAAGLDLLLAGLEAMNQQAGEREAASAAARTGAVAPDAVLPVGLRMLAALTALGQCDAVSLAAS